MKRIPLLLGVLCLMTILIWQVRTIWIPILAISPQQGIDPETIVSEFNNQEKYAVFNNRLVQIPQEIEVLSQFKPTQTVLGDSDAGKKILVDLTNQLLYAYEGNNKVYEFLISSGKWGRTPTGTFNIWIKLLSTKMEGGRKELGTYYYLPNVPFVMYFYNDEIPKWRGFGLHGTYWHNNFGHPMSHGCVNLKTEDAEKLYYWSEPDLQGKSSIHASSENPGTIVIIYGQAPLQ